MSTLDSSSTGTSGEGTLRALIDVGTNSVKLLVARVRGHVVEPLVEQSEQTRLGKGFYEHHLLQPDAIERTARAVAEFVVAANEFQPRRIRVIATSAARDAHNQQELLAAIQAASGLRVEVITGEQEAEWVYHGVTTDPRLAGGRLLIMDVGGGSTEFILGEGEHRHFRESFRLGSVRSLEQFPPADPPGPGELVRMREEVGRFVRTQVLPELGPQITAGGIQCRLVGTGGAATILGRILLELEQFDRDRLEGAVLPLPAVSRVVDRLWSCSLEERRKIVGLPKKRADVILSGAVIYEQVVVVLGVLELRVSTRGLRYGGLLEESLCSGGGGGGGVVGKKEPRVAEASPGC